MVNLATGEAGELAVYDPHPTKVAEVDEYQQGGTCRFIYAAGLKGYSNTANWETHITIPTNENEYEEKYFCKSCRELISGHAENGVLLLDLREPEEFSILSLGSDEIQKLRCYEIQTTQRSKVIDTSIHGTLDIMDHIIQN